MSEIQNQIKKWPVTAIKKIKSTFGSAEKFYATVYLIARNEHHCQMMGSGRSGTTLEDDSCLSGYDSLHAR